MSINCTSVFLNEQAIFSYRQFFINEYENSKAHDDDRN